MFDERVQLAIQLHKRGRLKEAGENYRSLLDINAAHPDLNHNLGLIQRISGKKEHARRRFAKAVLTNPQNTQYWRSYLTSLIDSQKTGEARRALNFARSLGLKLSEVDVLIADIISLRAQEMINGNSFDSTLRLHRKSILLRPDNMRFYARLSSAEGDQGDQIASITNLKRANVLNPANAVLHYNLGHMALATSMKPAALTHFFKAAILNPATPEIYNNLGLVAKGVVNKLNLIRIFERAIICRPDMAKLYNSLANETNEKTPKAVAGLLKKSLVLDPLEGVFNTNLANIFNDCRQHEVAVKYYKRALFISPSDDQSKHMFNSLTGVTTNRAPKAYVKDLFDRYASKFDVHLVGDLRYKIPNLTREFYNKIFDHDKQKLNILDLGCGTGLSGGPFKDLSLNLVGVDLSEKMLLQAKSKNIYDELIAEDIHEILEYYIVKKNRFGLFLCFDTIIYIGDCSKLFTLMAKVGLRNSRFLLTTQKTEDCDYKLLETGRYAHSTNYIVKVAKKSGFKLLGATEVISREEPSGPIIGDLFAFELGIQG